MIDAFSRKVVGWQLASHMRTDLVLDALRMALGQREQGADFELVNALSCPDRGSGRSAARTRGDGVVIERRQAAAQDVDDPMTTSHPQVIGSVDLGRGQPLSIVQAGRVDPLEEAMNGLVGLGKPDGVGGGDDPVEVRTRELVLGHDRP